MANGNTNPGIGENAESGVMHNPISQGFAQDLVSREGQRPRCPCGGESGSGDAAPPRGLCASRFADSEVESICASRLANSEVGRVGRV